MAIEQAGFTKGRGTRDQISTLRWINNGKVDIISETNLYVLYRQTDRQTDRQTELFY